MIAFALFSIALAGGQTSDPIAARVVPDIVVVRPRPERQVCVESAPRPGSRVRRTECRTYEEWTELRAVQQDQADVLYRRGGRMLMDGELGEAAAEGLAANALRRRGARSQAEAARGG